MPEFGRKTIRGASLISSAFACGNRQPLNLAANKLLELVLPALPRPRNEEES
jgi:hypothetical protein